MWPHLEEVEFDLILAEVDALAGLSTVEVVGHDQQGKILGEESSLQTALHLHQVLGLSGHVIQLSLHLVPPKVQVLETLSQSLHRLLLNDIQSTANYFTTRKPKLTYRHANPTFSHQFPLSLLDLVFHIAEGLSDVSPNIYPTPPVQFGSNGVK